MKRHFLALIRSFSVAIAGTLLTLLTLVFGGSLLLAHRRVFGGVLYWITGALIVTVLAKTHFLFAAFVGATWMTVGSYVSLGKWNRSFVWLPSVMSVVSGLATFSVLAIFYQTFTSVHVYGEVEKLVSTVLAKASEINPSVTFNKTELMYQVPSVLVITLTLNLYFALLFDRVALWLAGNSLLSGVHATGRRKALSFRLPDFFIWIPLLAAAQVVFKIGSNEIKLVSMNVINISFVLFFLQGFVVVEALLLKARAGVFGRTLTYFLGFSYGLMIFSVLGLADVWIDFRKRFTRPKPTV